MTPISQDLAITIPERDVIINNALSGTRYILGGIGPNAFNRTGMRRSFWLSTAGSCPQSRSRDELQVGFQLRGAQGLR